MSEFIRKHLKVCSLSWVRTEKTGWALFYIATGLVFCSGVVGLSAYSLGAFYILLALGLILVPVAALLIILYHTPRETDSRPQSSSKS